MKKRFDALFQWSDRTKLIVSAAATGAVLLFAALFPLTVDFAVPAEETAARLEIRTALFAQYWSSEGNDPALTVTPLENPSGDTVRQCGAKMQHLIDRWAMDEHLDYAGPTGSEYFSISDGETTLTVCRMWLEQSGDWKNWLDVCFDAETGDLYYFYLSSGLLESGTGTYDLSDMDCDYAVSALAAELAGSVRYTSGETDGTETAVILTEGGTAFYTVNCSAYDWLIDVKINCF